MKDFNEVGSEDYFFFFKKPYLKKTVIFSSAYLGISLLAALLCYLPIIYAMIPLTLMIVIYAFNPDLTVTEIVTLGFNLGNKSGLLSLD